MPIAEHPGHRPRFIDRDGELPHRAGGAFDRLFGSYLPGPSGTIGPTEILAAIEAMDDAQRARLARLLGVEARHPLLWTPGRSGAFLPPVVVDPSIPPGVAVMVDHRGREVGRMNF